LRKSTIREAKSIDDTFWSIGRRNGGAREAAPTNRVGWKVFAAFARARSWFGCDVSGECLGDGQSNEITAIPQLLDQLDLTNAVVTIDAAGNEKSGRA
jgi:hypothetical protein